MCSCSSCYSRIIEPCCCTIAYIACGYPPRILAHRCVRARVVVCGLVRSSARARCCVSAIRLDFVLSRCNAFRVLSIRSRAPLVVRARGYGGESAVLRLIVLCNAENALRGIVAVSVRRECVPVFASVYRCSCRICAGARSCVVTGQIARAVTTISS